MDESLSVVCLTDMLEFASTQVLRQIGICSTRLWQDVGIRPISLLHLQHFFKFWDEKFKSSYNRQIIWVATVFRY